MCSISDNLKYSILHDIQVGCISWPFCNIRLKRVPQHDLFRMLVLLIDLFRKELSSFTMVDKERFLSMKKNRNGCNLISYLSFYFHVLFLVQKMTSMVCSYVLTHQAKGFKPRSRQLKCEHLIFKEIFLVLYLIVGRI